MCECCFQELRVVVKPVVRAVNGSCPGPRVRDFSVDVAIPSISILHAII